MFLLRYFERTGFGAAATLATIWLIVVLKLYLTDFLTRTFWRENA
jgi:hypothetical protein